MHIAKAANDLSGDDNGTAYDIAVDEEGRALSWLSSMSFEFEYEVETIKEDKDKKEYERKTAIR